MAHPRSRGENCGGGLAGGLASGSSPLTRGKRSGRHDAAGRRGLIPAHAGKTHCSVLSVCRGAAHPRSRGENRKCGFAESSGGGSSPLTRGKRMVRVSETVRVGLIPAHAGKTGPTVGAGPPCGAHPRSRGENADDSIVHTPILGSSPLTRGKLGRRWLACGACGLIPAHAGKTSWDQPHVSTPPAHPRSRGENPGATHEAWTRAGSSPLTRGKLLSVLGGSLSPRLIPAHAGKT